MYMNETEKITYDSPFEVGFAGSKDAYHQNPPCYGYNPRTSKPIIKKLQKKKKIK